MKDLDVDEEAVDEREPQLDSHGGHTEADTNAPSPILSTGLIVSIVFPLKKILLLYKGY